MHWPSTLCTATLVLTLAPLAAAQPAPDASEEPSAPSSTGQQPTTPATVEPDRAMPPPPSELTAEDPPQADPDAQADEAEDPELPPLGPAPGAGQQEGEQDDEDAEPELPITPPAADSLGGHFVLGASAGRAWPFGRLSSNLRQHQQLDPGWSLQVDAGVGVGRQVVLGGALEYTALQEGTRCKGCEGTSLAIGPLVRFHLVQGLRFDPWASFGVAYRRLTIDGPEDTLEFVGIDWARLQVGGDWYPAKNVGVGPFLQLVSGGHFDRPDNVGDLRTYWQLTLGLRLVLDVPGKPN